MIEPVYRRLAPEVRAFCGHLLGQGADADDASQEALVKLFGQLGDYDASRDALAWALTIAAWECRTTRRKRTRARTVPLAEEPEGGAESGALLEEKERAELLAAAREALSANDQATLDAVLEGLSGDAAFRKRKERMLERLRGFVRRAYDIDL